MHVFSGVAGALLGHRLDHGHEVVPGLLLDLLDPAYADRSGTGHAGYLVGIGLGYGAERGVRSGQGGFHVHLVLYAALLAEDRLHTLASVSVVKGADVAHRNRPANR